MNRFFIASSVLFSGALLANREAAVQSSVEDVIPVVDSGLSTLSNSTSILERSFDASSPLVFFVLLTLILMSITTWAIFFAKWFYLRKIEKRTSSFLNSFEESRSLKELHSHLDDLSYSPLKEVFKMGYRELLRTGELKSTKSHTELSIGASMDNLKRTIHKTKLKERRQLQSYMTFLAISASSCPFIGLFGTVWGIMTAMEGIARSGSTSLATVAPGISEALIATAFGLLAAIPAVVAYNIAGSKIRSIMSSIDLFTADFLNVVERFFVSQSSAEKSKTETLGV